MDCLSIFGFATAGRRHMADQYTGLLYRPWSLLK